MENDILLARYQKKLSVYFALFILLSLWITQSIFMISNYISNNLRIIDKIETRVDGIKNVLTNKDAYIQKLQSNDTTLRTLMEKTLQGVTIYENDRKILWDIDKDIFSGNATITYSQQYIFFQTHAKIGGNAHLIIIQTFNEYSYYRLLREMLLFVLFSLPFSILFYFLGYFFVWKNLKPIYETINSLEDFSGNINHEIKTPLTEIISTLGLAKRLKANYNNAIDQSLRSANKINKILDSMQGIIHLIDASYKKERIDLVVIITNIIWEYKPLCEKKNIKIHTFFSEDSYVFSANRAHIEICIGNILKNAVKYSHKNGKIDISLGKWDLIIKDYGIWIEEENLGHIFDRYFRENYTKEEWYGLWLALVKKIIDINGWSIEIGSKKDKGTIVTIHFNKK